MAGEFFAAIVVLGTFIALATHRWGFALSAAVLIILPAAATLARYVPHARPEPAPIASGADAPAARSLPWRRLRTLGLALVEFYMVDTAVTTWAPTYLHHTFASPASLVAVATLPYLVCSLLSRSAAAATG
ncbi:hypothetical protein [Dermacoccus sp. Ellin185]|uniref:hypothetical protein n=1 Tax=Dermacoccus sp. Ellin185 TaxID=188626 RepID=UPI0001E645BC|nr:hypothetical protein [Dermacoccus sp. Ellin185]EFP56680.1 hypothetical protein HMPREF0321_0340 [Dermacoccus sp. Ellin185]